ncbi:MAG: ATP-binding protein [Promethearchaeota archaeon]
MGELDGNSTGNLVGHVVERSTSTKFTFVLQDKNVSVGSYLLAKTELTSKQERRSVNVLCQVTQVSINSDYLLKSMNPAVVENIIRQNITNVYYWGEGKIIGYYEKDDNAIIMPRVPLTPGEPLFTPSKEYLEKILSMPKLESISIGSLANRPDIPVRLGIRGFNRHVSILAQTGAGKSYCTGVIIEELARLGATIVVIDSHADYVYMGIKSDGSHDTEPWQSRITVFKNPISSERYNKDSIGVASLKEFQLAFDKLDSDIIFEIAGIPSNASNIREYLYFLVDAFKKCINQAANEGKSDRDNSRIQGYTLDDFINKVEYDAELTEEINNTDFQSLANRKKENKKTALSLLKYVRKLKRLGIFGNKNIEITEITNFGRVSIIDLSGMPDRAADAVVSIMLHDIYDEVESGRFEFPVYVFIEECHKFVPRYRSTLSKGIITKIAREGRKFGVFQVLISQRPANIDPDSLSQCNSQIILRITNVKDQKAVQESAEQLGEALFSDLPGLNRGEAIIVGPITKIPVQVKIGKRTTKEGGADIDVVERLCEARKLLKEEEDQKKNKELRRTQEGFD